MSGTTAISSGIKAADTLIYTGRGTLNGLTVYTDGTNAATVTLYDGTTAAGNILTQVIVAGADRTESVIFNLAVRCLNGIYADVTGTGATYIVYFGA
jgi:hypothetical protein